MKCIQFQPQVGLLILFLPLLLSFFPKCKTESLVKQLQVVCGRWVIVVAALSLFQGQLIVLIDRLICQQQILSPITVSEAAA